MLKRVDYRVVDFKDYRIFAAKFGIGKYKVSKLNIYHGINNCTAPDLEYDDKESAYSDIVCQLSNFTRPINIDF